MKRGYIIFAVVIFFVLAAAVIYAFAPASQSPAMRDAQRYSDVYSIESALLQYAKDHSGRFPSGLSADELEICRTDSPLCTDLVDLSELTADQKYLISLPLDPQCPQSSANCSENGTGYYAALAGGKVTITSYGAEDGDISITR